MVIAVGWRAAAARLVITSGAFLLLKGLLAAGDNFKCAAKASSVLGFATGGEEMPVTMIGANLG